MASELVVPVVEIKNVRAHPGADSLDLCDVGGHQICVPKGRYKDGEVVVYFPADVLIPPEWADKFGVRKYLKGKDNDRVGRIRLRGEPSFGLCVALGNPEWKVGDNVADYYGAKKYELPIRVGCGDAAERDPDIDPFFDKFTDVQSGRIFTDVLRDGEEVIFTEKIHGCFRDDSMVMLANGEERQISDIKEGMSVLTMNESTGATEVKKVLAVKVQDPLVSRWVRLVLENGREIICTEEHLFLTKNRGYVKAIDLASEDDMEEPTL